MGKGFRVTVEDLDNGEKQSRDVQAGDYMLIPFAPCRLTATNRFSNGTVQITLRGHAMQPPHRPAAGGGQ